METTLSTQKIYKPILDIFQTERAIKFIKDSFQQNLSSALRLRRVTAPLMVEKGSGINDDLNGYEKPVSFTVKGLGREVEIVQSLAKWKRMALAQYGIPEYFGIYTDMNALRPDEIPSPIHSVYVDQWDWEIHITKEKRDLVFLMQVVRKIYESLKKTEYQVYEVYPQLVPVLPEDIYFIHAEDLLKKYPGLSPKERETEIAKEYGAVFIIGIGAVLSDGKKHDGRAPDYDDWTTETEGGKKGLNGDIILWNSALDSAFEISSMGIRVDKEALQKQLYIEDATQRLELPWHKALLEDKYPLSLGGGIGQSRLCMFLMRKKHIGEVQSSVWPKETIATCKKDGIVLL